MIRKFFTFNNCILLFLLLTLLLFLRWNSFSAPFERDEGEYAYSAWITVTGKGVPYIDSFLQKPPMIIYTYMLAYFLNHDAVWPPRILATLAIFTSAFLVCAIVKSRFQEKLGWLAAFLTVIVLSAPFYTALSANTELFLIPPLLAVVYIYISKKEEASPKDWFLAGVLTAISLLFKPVGLYIFIYIFALWIIDLFKAKKSWSEILKNISFLLLGGFLASLVILLPFILKGALKDLIESAVTFNMHYAKMWGLDLSGFKFEIARLVKYWWVLILLLGAFFLKKVKDGYYFLGLFGVSILAVFQSVIGHYYLLILPFLVILSVIGLNNTLDALSKLTKNISVIYLGIITVILLLWPIRILFGLTPKEITLWVYGTQEPFYEADVVATEVAKITDPDDLIFVGGSEAEIYYYAKRASSSRFVITYPLNLKTALREKYQKEAITELTDTNPVVIVVSQRHMSGLWDKESPRYFIDFLTKLVNEKYELIGGYVWNNLYGYWQDKPTPSEIQNSSLLLYKKI